MGTVLTQFTVDGVALWVVLLICGGVFLGSFMDAIAGGGGIITVPTYLMGLSDFPIYNALGTNKLSSGIGTVFSTVRFIRQGYVDWALFAPAIVLADEISPDTCRFWDAKTGEKLDKDRFRRDLGNVEGAYQEMARRLMGK